MRSSNRFYRQLGNTNTMRPGGGKTKGAEFERWVCKQLSLWVSSGYREDVFARSALSGGRATNLARKGKEGSAVSGDIASVHPLGHEFVSHFYIECKFIRDAEYVRFFLYRKGLLAGFWETAVREARRYEKIPLIVVRQNRLEPLILAPKHALIVANLVSCPIDSGQDYSEAVLPWSLYRFQALIEQPYSLSHPLLEKAQ